MILHKRWLKWVLGLSIFALSTGMLAFFGGNYVATGDPDESSESEEVSVAPGTLDDGAHLIDQAAISLEAALLAAQGAADGSVGEVDLETCQDALVFNVDIGNADVKVVASNGAILVQELETDDH